MKPKNKGGRPAKLTLALVEEIGDCIALGMTEEQACLLVGVSYKSFKSAQTRKPEFAVAIKERQAVFLDEALKAIRGGIQGWQGRAWILERRHKPQFNRTDTHAVTDPEGKAAFTAEDLLDMEKMTKALVKDMRK